MINANNKLINALIENICDNFFDNLRYEDFATLNKKTTKFYELIWDNNLFTDIKYDIENIVIGIIAETERQSFIYGFKKAIAMMEKGDYYDEYKYRD